MFAIRVSEMFEQTRHPGVVSELSSTGEWEFNHELHCWTSIIPTATRSGIKRQPSTDIAAITLISEILLLPAPSPPPRNPYTTKRSRHDTTENILFPLGSCYTRRDSIIIIKSAFFIYFGIHCVCCTLNNITNGI